MRELDQRYRKQGLSIVGLGFELTGDQERDLGQLRRFAQRRGRIRSVEENASLLAALPIKRVAAPLEQVLALAVKHSLSGYDALYLGLALKRRLPVATLDEALTRAARAERLQVLGA